MKPLIVAILVCAGSFGTARADDLRPMAELTIDPAAVPAPGMPGMAGMPGMLGVWLPFGVMAGQAGHWMVAYQYAYESQAGLLQGAQSVGTDSVLRRYGSAPVDMTMRMQMAMLMFAPTDKLSLMAMLPTVQMSMDERHQDGSQTTESTEGFGDLELGGQYQFFSADDGGHRISVLFGAAFPTGSTGQADPSGARMEYPMQSGSGSFALLPGLCYLGQALPWSWGTELKGTFHLNQNQQGYTLGDRYEPQAWVARAFGDLFSASAGLRAESIGDIRGADSSLDPADEPTKDTGAQGGTSLNASAGLALHPAKGLFGGQQLSVEGEVPSWQSLDGPQLRRLYRLKVAWQYGF